MSLHADIKAAFLSVFGVSSPPSTADDIADGIADSIAPPVADAIAAASGGGFVYRQFTFIGAPGAGPATMALGDAAPTTLVGDEVVDVVATGFGNVNSYFESTITVNGQIQQTFVGLLDGFAFILLIKRAVA